MTVMTACVIGDVNFITKASDARFGLIGGRFLGEATLLRFYVLHCIGLPFIIMLIVSIVIEQVIRSTHSHI